MARPVTLFTVQWADLPLETVAALAAGWGYDGLELACAGDHLDAGRAAADLGYVGQQLQLLARHGLKVWAVGNPLASQLVSDPDNDERSDAWAPANCAGDPDRKREWAIQAMKDSARAAANLGASVVTGCSGSPIWHLLYSQPPVLPRMIEQGYARFAELWHPILDVFDACGVKFALEVMPTQIAYDVVTAQRALEALGHRPAFGFNFDPSHLFWQMVDPARFIDELGERIYHVHIKDTALHLDGRTGILGSHLPFGDRQRAWEFRTPGRGGVNFEAIIRGLNGAGYHGPLSVEWEDSGMERQEGAREACQFVRRLDFTPSAIAFDSMLRQSPSAPPVDLP
jgi:sugar phosphate isomerase/epimerase